MVGMYRKLLKVQSKTKTKKEESISKDKKDSEN